MFISPFQTLTTRDRRYKACLIKKKRITSKWQYFTFETLTARERLFIKKQTWQKRVDAKAALRKRWLISRGESVSRTLPPKSWAFPRLKKDDPRQLCFSNDWIWWCFCPTLICNIFFPQTKSIFIFVLTFTQFTLYRLRHNMAVGYIFPFITC